MKAWERAAFVAANATIVGRVELGRDASVWYGAVIRGDSELISLGDETNVQENCVLHTDEGIPMRIGNRVTVGHAAVLHGCTIDEEVLIGIGAVILNHARIRRHCIVGARALITEGKDFPERSLIMGAPAKVARVLTDEEVTSIKEAAAHYVRAARRFASGEVK